MANATARDVAAEFLDVGGGPGECRHGASSPSTAAWYWLIMAPRHSYARDHAGLLQRPSC
jgi:hypothetical protein